MKKIIILFLLALSAISCKKLVEVGTPKNLLIGSSVFSDSSSAVAALDAAYAQLNLSVEPNYSTLMDIYTDDLDYTNSDSQYLEFYHSAISPGNFLDLTPWQDFYQIIYECNALITQLPVSGKLSPATLNQLSNEAKFLRAYAYFYLVNLYGRVPLVLGTDVSQNAVAAQSDSSVIYHQVIADLSAAQTGLSAAYQGGGRVRVNRFAAAALLARVYLYQKNWAAAETASSEVINSGLYTLTDPSQVFLANNNEAILQLWNQYGYVISAETFLVPPPNTLPEYPVTASLLNTFENGDLRKTDWLGTSIVPNGSTSASYYFFNKYKNTVLNTSNPEYLVVLRLSEQYLIRAEARAQQGKLTGSGGAADDVNIIRQRAGLQNTTAATQTDMLSAILKERRVELFGEWGARFNDLKRDGLLNAVIGAEKPAWVPTAALFPIPANELTYDHNLVQNPGYH